MKLGLISSSLELKQVLEANVNFQVHVVSSLEETEDAALIVASSKEVDLNALTVHFSDPEKRSGKQLFYILHKIESAIEQTNVESICQARGIHVIPPLSIGQIAERIIRRVFPEGAIKKDNVVVFFGADAKAGTTMVSLDVSKKFEAGSRRKVLFISLSDNPAGMYLKTPDLEQVAMDEIKIKVLNKMLAPEELVGACIKQGNLHILQGPKYIPDRRYYQPEHIEFLIEIGSQIADLIVIDAGSNIERGLTIGALKASKYRYLVTTQQEVPLKRYEVIENDILRVIQIKPQEFMLVINRYIDGISQYSEERVAERYKMHLAASIPDLANMGWQAEIDKQSLLSIAGEEYRFKIQQLCVLMSNQTGLPFEPDIEMKKKGMLGRIAAFLPL